MPLFTSQSKIFLKFPVWVNCIFPLAVLQTPLVNSHRLFWALPRVTEASVTILSTRPCSARPPWTPARVSCTRPSAPSAHPSTACPRRSPSSARPWATPPWAARPPLAWPSDPAWAHRWDVTAFTVDLFNSFSMNCCGQQHRVLLQILSEACSWSIFFSRVCSGWTWTEFSCWIG